MQLVAAGGMFDGRSIAAAIMYGAGAVWVGTRFVTARESNAPEGGKQALVAHATHLHHSYILD